MMQNRFNQVNVLVGMTDLEKIKQIIDMAENWCPDDDEYWKECHCPTCLKNWIEDQ